MRAAIVVLSCGFVAGCAVFSERNAPFETEPDAAVLEPIGTETDVVRPRARPGEADVPVDTGVPEVSIGTLGRTVASLGNAAEPGLWLKTPLVTTRRSGRVYAPETGQTVAVTLIPIEGAATAGSRLSLQAMQALGVPLTALPEIDVLAG